MLPSTDGYVAVYLLAGRRVTLTKAAIHSFFACTRLTSRLWGFSRERHTSMEHMLRREKTDQLIHEIRKVAEALRSWFYSDGGEKPGWVLSGGLITLADVRL